MSSGRFGRRWSTTVIGASGLGAYVGDTVGSGSPAVVVVVEVGAVAVAPGGVVLGVRTVVTVWGVAGTLGELGVITVVPDTVAAPVVSSANEVDATDMVATMV